MSKYQAAQREWIVANQQFGIQQFSSSIAITEDSQYLDISTAEDSHLINDLIYYMNYGLAVFGWPMQVVDDPCMLCCIFPYLKLSRCCGGAKRRSKVAAENVSTEPELGIDSNKESSEEKDVDEIGKNKSKNPPMPNKKKNKYSSKPGVLNDDFEGPIILNDNCCGCNVASVERRLAAHNYEIIYATYKVEINLVPFLVVADHSKQSIVLALRGSMSLSDMVTDMNGQADKIPIENCPDDWLSHRGITRAATNVLQKLRQERILDRAFNCRPDLGSQDYNLILCGHSLGAGVSAILGILMRDQYPTLKAYLYSPPGGLLSLPAVEYTKQFATGIILGNDCVARLGIAQLERLRYHVLLSLKSSNQSTGKILSKAVFPNCCFGGNKVEYDPNKSLNLLYGTDGRAFDYNGNKILFQNQPQLLYVPGKLIHIVKNYSFRGGGRKFFTGPLYQAVWSENTTYDRLLISEGMLFDHMPFHVMHAMKMLFSKTLPARKDSKTSIHTDGDDPHHGKRKSHLNKMDSLGENIVDRKVDLEVVIEGDNNNNNTTRVESDINNNQEGNDIPASASPANASTKELVDKNGNDEKFLNKNNEQMAHN